MKKQYRLRRTQEFEHVRKAGLSWTHPLIVFCLLPNNLPHSRFGFAVSKRIGKAVVRNRVKRLMHEAVRVRQNGIQPGWDIVFIARRSIQEADYHQIDKAVAELLERAKVTKKENAGGAA